MYFLLTLTAIELLYLVTTLSTGSSSTVLTKYYDEREGDSKRGNGVTQEVEKAGAGDIGLWVIDRE